VATFIFAFDLENLELFDELELGNVSTHFFNKKYYYFMLCVFSLF
jgi:hypothetical protein